MNILFFTDIHGDMKVLDRLKDKAKEADLVVCAGDISKMGSKLSEIMAEINDFEKPVLMIHGNHEDEDAMRELCELHENLIFLHEGVHHVDDYIFMGYGGDGFSMNDSAFTKVSDKFFTKQAADKKRMILITHGPPYGTDIDKINGAHVGNKSYRKFIDEIKPHIAISGHLHENSGKHHKIGRTLFLNPGKEGIFVNI